MNIKMNEKERKREKKTFNLSWHLKRIGFIEDHHHHHHQQIYHNFVFFFMSLHSVVPQHDAHI